MSVQRIEAKPGLLLGLLTQLPSQGREWRREVLVPPRRLVRSTLFQSAFLLSYANTSPVGSLRSIPPLAGFLRYYKPLRLPTRPSGSYVFPPSVEAIALASPGLPGSSAGLSACAVPIHPGRPDGCLRSLLHHQRRASPLLGGLTALLSCNEAESGSLSLRLTRSLSGASTQRITPLAARFPTCRTSNYQGHLLSDCKTSQSFPGAPKAQRHQGGLFWASFVPLCLRGEAKEASPEEATLSAFPGGRVLAAMTTASPTDASVPCRGSTPALRFASDTWSVVCRSPLTIEPPRRTTGSLRRLGHQAPFGRCSRTGPERRVRAQTRGMCL